MRIKKFSLSFGSQLFKAFSDESRVRILSLLYTNKQLCISDLEHILDFTQTKTSRHLNYLKNSGIVSQKKVDRWVFYFIKDEVQDLVSQLFSFMRKDPTLLKDQEMYQILYSNRELAINKIENKKWLNDQL